MKTEPRYDGPSVLAIEGDPTAPFVRQRRRFLATLESLSEEQWRAPTRCDCWTVQDVAAHLVTVNGFWQASIVAGLAGQPTRMLVDFDPKATPELLVAGARSATPAETLAELRASSDGVCDLVAPLDDHQRALPAEGPSGHIPVSLLINHGLWDCWVHERDVALPLGLPLTEDPDEVLAGLRFVAGLGAGFALTAGVARPPASLVIEATDPDACVVVEVSDHVEVHDQPPADPTVTLRGDAVDLVEALSCRAPLDQPVAPEHEWLVGYLGQLFETV